MEYWIVGIGGNEDAGVSLHKVFGTKEEIKAYIVSRVQAEKENPDADFDFGSDTPEDIEEQPNGALYGYACFDNSYIDYEAMPLDSIPEFICG